MEISNEQNIKLAKENQFATTSKDEKEREYLYEFELNILRKDLKASEEKNAEKSKKVKSLESLIDSALKQEKEKESLHKIELSNLQKDLKSSEEAVVKNTKKNKSLEIHMCNLLDLVKTTVSENETLKQKIKSYQKQESTNQVCLKEKRIKKLSDELRKKRARNRSLLSELKEKMLLLKDTDGSNSSAYENQKHFKRNHRKKTLDKSGKRNRKRNSQDNIIKNTEFNEGTSC